MAKVTMIFHANKNIVINLQKIHRKTFLYQLTIFLMYIFMYVYIFVNLPKYVIPDYKMLSIDKSMVSSMFQFLGHPKVREPDVYISKANVIGINSLRTFSTL